MQLIDKTKAKLDKNGIWKTSLGLSEEVALSKKVWDNIYNYGIKTLEKDIKKFNKTKLQDHLKFILKSYDFTDKTVYLEIGCGPSYIGEYLLKTYNCYFIGVDLNYEMLVTLKKYLDSKGYKKYILIHADINQLPIKNETIDYIYGGGVIEHLPDTKHILKELYRVLKKGGVSFNTIPAFNLWWLIRFYNNIPSLPGLKQLFEFIHIKVLKEKILSKYYGYELSYIPIQLWSLHNELHFKHIHTGPFTINPDPKKLHNLALATVYRILSSNILTCPVYYVYGVK